MKILAVDGNTLSREVLRTELEQLHLAKDLRCVASLPAAEEILESFLPDVLLLDLQLPEYGAFRLVDRPWEQGVPVIVCITVFDRDLLEVLSRRRVDHLVRPFGQCDLHYAITQNRRPGYVGSAFILRNLLDAAADVGCPVGHGMSSWRGGKLLATSISTVIAIHREGSRYFLWTESGVQVATGISPQVNQAIRSGAFAKIHENGVITSRPHLFPGNYHRALLWLWWHWLKGCFRRFVRQSRNASIH
ncbi:MAG TPA: response regulator [Bryobacteraceae bacterium]|nr:response regulator [Bryobacteraceae bacterium]